MCVNTIDLEGNEQRGNEETVEIENRERRVSKQHTQIRSNPESETIPSMITLPQKTVSQAS